MTVASDEDFDNEVGDDFREMVGDLISNFVTNPDLEKGFRWSGKTRSHYDLEDIAIRLRRRLAGTFLSLERPVGLGGLLDNAYVHENVLDKIHELGQTVDDVCNECLTAKRGSAALTKRLEKLEHSAKQLDNWVEWLRHPTIPGADGKPVPLPPGDPPVAAPEDAGAAGPSNGQALQMPAGDRMSYAAELERKQASKRQAAAEKQAAADRAMAALLEGALIAPMAAAAACAAVSAFVSHTAPVLHACYSSSVHFGVLGQVLRFTRVYRRRERSKAAGRA